MSVHTIVTGDIEPYGEREMQFYGGNDCMEMYRVGDTVNWFINEDVYGSAHLLDGVYGGSFEAIRGIFDFTNFRDGYIIIKDHVIVAIGEVPPIAPSDWDETFRREYELPIRSNDMDRTLYSDKAVAKHDADMAARARTAETELSAYLSTATPASIPIGVNKY